MSEVTTSPSDQDTVINWEAQYERQLTINETLTRETVELKRQLANLQRTHADYKKSSEQEFRCLKAEIITSLRAIDLCILASLCTEKQHLTHRQRNFRMRHVHQIIGNEVDRFGDRRLTNYEDDY
jgi:hypothetical protein